MRRCRLFANSIAAPQFNADKTQLTWNTPEGVKVEFLADYEQIVGRDGKIYQPLTDTEIKGVYKVTKTAASATDKKRKIMQKRQ